jgi:hypothetical protein
MAWKLWLILRYNLPGETEEKHRSITLDSQSLVRYMNLGSPEYKAGVHVTDHMIFDTSL